MSGLFGSYLDLVHEIGRGVLYVLIGPKASDTSRTPRLLLGSLFIGSISGAAIAFVRDMNLIVCAVVVSVFMGIVTGTLEAIRHRLEK